MRVGVETYSNMVVEGRDQVVGETCNNKLRRVEINMPRKVSGMW